MLKKYFGFVAAAGLVGTMALAACTVKTADAPAGDAGTPPTDAKMTPDAKPKTDAMPMADSCPRNLMGKHDEMVAAFSAAPPDGPGPHKATPKSTGACTDAMITALP
jgi:hypothetical protein